MARVLYDSHMHTPLCKHAEGMPEDYALAAERRGLAGIVMTCHNPLPDGLSSAVRMRLDEWEVYVSLVDHARRDFEGRVDVRLGVEADYIPGLESFLERQLSDDRLHHVLGSVHPFIGDHWSCLNSDPVGAQRVYFDLLAQAAETGLFDTLSHPDLIKNFTARGWDLGRVMPDIQRALDRIADTGVAMELNTSGLYKTIPEYNPGPAILEQVHQRGIPVIVNSDSHTPKRVGDQFVEALDLLQAIGFESVCFFLDRKRRDVSIDTARESLLAVERV